VVIRKGIKALEKKIREDEKMATAITMLQQSFTKKREGNSYLVKPDSIFNIAP
jgi:hypothetical protein